MCAIHNINGTQRNGHQWSMLLLVFDELILLYTSNVILVYDIFLGWGEREGVEDNFIMLDIVSIN